MNEAIYRNFENVLSDAFFGFQRKRTRRNYVLITRSNDIRNDRNSSYAKKNLFTVIFTEKIPEFVRTI